VDALVLQPAQTGGDIEHRVYEEARCLADRT